MAVLHFLHRMQDAALHRLEAVFDVGYGAVEDHIGGIVEKPLAVHAREFVFVLAFRHQPVVLALGRVDGVLVHGLIYLLLFFGEFFASFVQFVKVVLFFHGH